MPTTTSAINARDVVVYLDNDVGSLVNISGSANEISIKMGNAIGDFNVFTDKYTYRTEGVQDISVDMTVVFTKVSAEAVDMLRLWKSQGGNRTIQINVPVGSGTLTDRYQGEVFWESLDIPLKADEAKPIMVKCSMKVSGDLPWSRV